MTATPRTDHAFRAGTFIAGKSTEAPAPALLYSHLTVLSLDLDALALSQSKFYEPRSRVAQHWPCFSRIMLVPGLPRISLGSVR